MPRRGLTLISILLLVAAEARRLFSPSDAVRGLEFLAGTFEGNQDASKQQFILRDLFFHGFSKPADVAQLHRFSTSSRKDVQRLQAQRDDVSSALAIRVRTLEISRARHPAEPFSQQRLNLHDHDDVHDAAASDVWETVFVPGPDLTDKATVVNLAKMCSDAYIFGPSQPDWLNTTLGFNHSYSFGWQGDGLRGHIFTDKLNKTVIVAFKGTTIDPGHHWTSKDRLNDNLLFSCCCATQRPDPFWYGRVCDCRTDYFQCNSTCLTQELVQEDRYYSTALAIMHNVSTWYPNASVWTIGHSLGGSIASLMGLRFNIPSVSIEAPPQRLAAERLRLALPPRSADYHIGNTADPIFMGACNGYFSSCSVAGFAFESQCHTGKRCVYDTVQDKGWRLSIANHRINVVIPQILEAYNSTPVCEADDECVECFNWKFSGGESQ
ncbi:hypothetical protein PV04_06071 [Phialophora macrospora]|uniref:Putative lipase ATG15 n=1 Tax=Phialophora macrospora TaxID=1851006 RepID=A0A0D2CNG3_9EURO|nr:hypothetical protein PV04_06071 [Phialophora macrospora]